MMCEDLAIVCTQAEPSLGAFSHTGWKKLGWKLKGFLPLFAGVITDDVAGCFVLVDILLHV